jgi:ankyrin repeat protein
MHQVDRMTMATVRMRVMCGVCLMALMSGASLHLQAIAGDATLLEAVKAGNHAAIGTLLQHPVGVNTPEADGTTALHWAVRADDLEVVQMLLRAGADVKASNRYGVTPLSLAALNGNAVMVGRLLDAGADPEARLAEDQTVLMAAARAGNTDVLKVLLTHGARVNTKEGVLGETALMWAALENHAGAVKVLVEHGADVDAQSVLTTFPKFKFGDGIVARATSLPRGGWTPLMYAARQGAIDAARALADAGADLNLTDPNGTSALVEAIINAHFDVAAVLVERGADPDAAEVTGMAALYAAVDMHTLAETVGRPNPKPRDTLDSLDIVKMLLGYGANPNALLKSPILDRVHNDGNSDAALGDGATALMRAAKQTDVAVIKLLLDGGADVNLATKKGMTPLMFAASHPAIRGVAYPGVEQDPGKAVALCLERGAHIDGADETGQTALHYAAALASDDVVRLLAEMGANLFVKDRQGRTPLDAALAGGGRGGRNAGVGIVAEGRSASEQAGDRASKAALLRQLMAVAAPKDAAQSR